MFQPETSGIYIKPGVISFITLSFSTLTVYSIMCIIKSTGIE